jgi:hypothetical protein
MQLNKYSTPQKKTNKKVYNHSSRLQDRSSIPTVSGNLGDRGDLTVLFLFNENDLLTKLFLASSLVFISLCSRSSALRPQKSFP